MLDTEQPAEPVEGQIEDRPHPAQETPLEGFASICGILVLGLFALTFIFQNFVIPSGSMQQTLLIGDHVFVDRESLAPPSHWAPMLHYREVKRGDIIVFFKPAELLYLVKRVVGVPGDRIHLVHGVVYLNGEPQNEPQARKVGEENDPNGAYSPERDDFPANGVPPGGNAVWMVDLSSHIQGQDLVMPPGQYFVMGDNRTNSADSRFWGFVPRENIVGRPLFVYWSFITPSDELEKTGVGERMSFFFHEVIHFFDQTRWRRTLHLVR
ncbi:MAG TPA: signal peptidase I [Acidisarcina sp.]